MKNTFLSVIYLSIYCIGYNQDITLGQGITEGITITTSSENIEGSAQNTLGSRGFKPNLNASSRFLSQSTFGSTYDEIKELENLGLEDWIDEQFNIPVGPSIMSEVIDITNQRKAANNDANGGSYDWYWHYGWWDYHMSNDDQLRQRLAFALSQLFVISRFSAFGDNAYALSTYYDMLLNNALGNYRTLLDSVTYHTAMGEFLTYMNNSRTDTILDLDWSVWPPDTLDIHYTFPDENYAREVMQLFTIGLHELNYDGTHKVDAQGKDIPTYDNRDIAELAKIFTGFSYGDNMNFGYGPGNWETTFRLPMQIYEEYHEYGEKYLLNGEVIPARSGTGWVHEDVKDALDHLFLHDNVGPFVGKFLIQRFVTSNPSPAYVSRVTDAFNGEGPYGTVRGDMQSLMKAILLDEEARSCTIGDDPDVGKLREPFIRYVQLGKAFGRNSDNGSFRNILFSIYDAIEQIPLSSPSVFNFYQSDYQPIGPIEDAQKVAPEFQITNTQSIAGYINGLTEWIMDDDYEDVWELYGNEVNVDGYRLQPDYSAELSLINQGRTDQLIDRLNVLIAHGKLQEGTINTIAEAVEQFNVSDDGLDPNLYKVKLAIYLIMASPDYLINR